MVKGRTELHKLLKSLFPKNQEPHVYFQPPQNTRIVYPCIIYKLEDMPGIWANNLPYHWDHSYEVTYITTDPQDPMIDRLRGLRKTRFNRPFVSDNLHHFVYTIFD